MVLTPMRFNGEDDRYRKARNGDRQSVRWFWTAIALFLPLLIGGRLPGAAAPLWRCLAAAASGVVLAFLWGAARFRRTAGNRKMPRLERQAIPAGDPVSEEAVPFRTCYPKMATVIMTMGAVCFFFLPNAFVAELCRLHLDDLNMPQLVLTAVAPTFLYADFGHLLLMAVLLGGLGFLLGPQLGRGQMLITLLLGSLVSNLIVLNLLLSDATLADGASRVLQCPPPGAAGAVAGLMGAWAVSGKGFLPQAAANDRLAQWLFLPRVVLMPVLIGLFFLGDFTGNTMPVSGQGGMAGYWGHLGSFMLGWTMAAVSKSLQAEDETRLFTRRDNSRPPVAGCEPNRRGTVCFAREGLS